MARKPATKAEKEHLMTIKRMSCCICGCYGVDAHHICDTGRRLGHYFTLPLCKKCHTGRDGFSGLNRQAWDKSLKSQLELCRKVYEKLGKAMPEPTTKIVSRKC